MPQVPQEQRKKLVQELLHIIKGKVLAISMKHDASRVVQTAIQFGSQEVKYAGMLLSPLRSVISEQLIRPRRRVLIMEMQYHVYHFGCIVITVLQTRFTFFTERCYHL